MELGTFGAIISFGIKLEDQAQNFYEQGARGQLEEPFGELARGSGKRLRRLERARRELVSEMILESIVGLDGDAYPTNLDPTVDEVERLEQARSLEEISVRFYQDAAAKMPIRQVVRLFQRMAQENQRRIAQLDS